MNKTTYLFAIFVSLLLYSCSSGVSKERTDAALKRLNELNTQLEKNRKENQQFADQFAQNVIANPTSYEVKMFNDMAVQVMKLTSDYIKELETLKVDLVQLTDGVDYSTAYSRLPDPSIIKNKAAISSVEKFFGVNPADPKGKATLLSQKTAMLQSNLKTFVITDTLATQEQTTQANDGIQLLSLSGEGWGEKTFGKKTVLEALCEINILENNSATAEHAVIQFLFLKQQKVIENLSKH